jgi:hypothetical protein
MQIRAVTDSLSGRELDDLTSLLVDSVEGGASLGFLKPLDEAQARIYWEGVSNAVQAGQKALLVAEIGGAILVNGSVWVGCECDDRQLAHHGWGLDEVVLVL